MGSRGSGVGQAISYDSRQPTPDNRQPTPEHIIWNNKPPLNVELCAMEKPVRRTLLPGVSDAGAPPLVIIDSRAVVARARRRAIVRRSEEHTSETPVTDQSR